MGKFNVGQVVYLIDITNRIEEAIVEEIVKSNDAGVLKIKCKTGTKVILSGCIFSTYVKALEALKTLTIEIDKQVAELENKIGTKDDLLNILINVFYSYCMDVGLIGVKQKVELIEQKICEYFPDIKLTRG